MTADILNPNVTASNSFDSAPVSKQDFGTPMYLAAPGSLGAGFTESVRYYSDSTGIATDLASGDLTQEAADALNVGLSQSPRPNLVACGQIPGAVSKVTEVTVGGTITDADAFTIDLTASVQLSYAATVPSDTAADVIAGLIASAVSEDYDRFTVEAGATTDKLLITDKIKGLDRVIAVGVVGVGTIIAAVVTPIVEPGEANSVEITAAGAEDDIWTLTIGEKVFTYTEPLAASVISIAQALKALVILDSDFQAVNETTVDDDTIIIAPFWGSTPFSAFSLTSSGAGTNAIVELEEAAVISTLMDALFFADSGWYGLVSQVKSQAMSLDLAAWAESNKRFFMAQESDPGLLTAEATSTGALFKGLAYARSVSDHHPTDTDELMFGVMAGKLAVDPDVAVTTWAYARAIGITPDLTITTTQRAALESTYTGFYNSIRGRSAYWEGKTADGNYIDTLISRDWFNARLAEAVTNVIVSASQRGSKIPFTDAGIQQIANVVRAFLFGTAIRIGHIERILDDNNNVVSPTVTPPRRRDVSSADVAARLIRIPYTANLTGAIHKAEITGYITTNLVTGEVAVS